MPILETSVEAYSVISPLVAERGLKHPKRTTVKGERETMFMTNEDVKVVDAQDDGQLQRQEPSQVMPSVLDFCLVIGPSGPTTASAIQRC